MSWFIIINIAYFLNAVSTVVNKFLLTKKIPNPAVYTFFICFLNLLALLLIPFGFQLYSWGQIIFALITGVLFAFSLLYMFKALHYNEASRITPFMGGLQPIFIFILAWIFLDETLSLGVFVAFIIIILGTVLLSWHYGDNLPPESKQSRLHGYFMALIATILFAIMYTMSKYVYLNQDFISGFVWTRIGAFIGSLILLIKPQNIKDVWQEIRHPNQKSGPLFLLGQAAGAISFVLVNYAIAIYSSVAVINALRGIEYVFLLIMVIILAKKWPHILEEKITNLTIAQKIIAITLIMIGLIIISLANPVINQS